jgi:hypothetical protein
VQRPLAFAGVNSSGTNKLVSTPSVFVTTSAAPMSERSCAISAVSVNAKCEGRNSQLSVIVKRSPTAITPGTDTSP